MVSSQRGFPMIEHENPDKKPFKIGQLVKEPRMKNLGCSVILGFEWDSVREGWDVLIYHQHEGKTFTEHSYHFEPAEFSND